MFKKGIYIIFGVPETSEFTKPPASYEFYGFSFRKSQERASKFGSILGRDQGLLFGSSGDGTELDWTCFKQLLNRFCV